MCRLVVYKGHEPILLSHLLTRPAHSIINQSFGARLRLDLTRGPMNGDGFGVGWYDAPSPSSWTNRLTSEGETPTSTTGSHNNERQLMGRVHSKDSKDCLEGDFEREEQEQRRKPCIFNSITPAWSNDNLSRLAEKIRSPLIFAHVRASTSGSLSEQNCHPWSFGRLMWMHNGGISGFATIKRRLQNALPENLFLFPQGSTDSEWSFALFLSFLPQHLLFPSTSPSTSILNGTTTLASSINQTSLHPHSRSSSTNINNLNSATSSSPYSSPFSPRMLKDAMLKTIEAINGWTKEAGAEEPSLLNFCVTDGESVVVTRYISSRDKEAASLFYSSGTSFTESPLNSGSYRMSHSAIRPDPLILIASEPLTFERSDWMEIPTNTLLLLTPNQNLLQIPIIDEFSPAYQHSSNPPSLGKSTSSPATTEHPLKRDKDFAISKGFGAGLVDVGDLEGSAFGGGQEGGGREGLAAAAVGA